MTAQLELFPIVAPSYRGLTIAEAFQAFAEANPHVYENLRRLALEHRRARPHEKIGMKYLYERLRWEYKTKTDRPENEFRLNNNFTAYYARALMLGDRELWDAFETRARDPGRPHRSGVKARAG
jgi:hypothetical protein